MIVTQLEEGSALFTLCFELNGEIQPISDFEDMEQAHYLQQEINKRGYGITLKIPSKVRKFSILKKKDGKMQETDTADNFETALGKVGIKVDFIVEAPETYLEDVLY